MPLMYYPNPGEILLCDFSTGFVPPEMVKLRPVIIISPRLRRRGSLATVVPLSTTAPEPIEPHHALVELEQSPPKPFDSLTMWAKCDMIYSVSLSRLDRFRVRRKGNSSARKYVSGQVEADQFHAIRIAVLCGLGLDSLTIHL